MPEPAGAGAVATAPASAWAPLRRPLFRSLWIATVFSSIGTWMHEVGAGWLMTSLAPTPLMVALVQAATSLPVVLLALPAGALADILDRRRYLLGAQLWMLAVAALLGILTVAGVTNAWVLLACTFALGIGAALMMPGWGATLPELVPRAELQSAVALNSMGMNVSRAIGPALAGLIVAASGPGVVFLLNAASFLSVIGVLYLWRRQPRDSTLPAERFFGALRAGLRYARHAPALQAVLIRGGAFFLFASASWALLPLVARQELGGGPQSYGLLMGCIGAGAVGGALLLPRLRARLSRDRLVAAATVLYAAAMLGLAYVRNLPLLSVAMLCSGAAWLSVLSSLQVAAQMALPGWVRARGLAVFMTVFMGGMAGGSILWGNVANAAGIPLTLTIAAAGALLGLAFTRLFPIGVHDDIDLAPSMHWPAPVVAAEPEPDRGPVMVTIEYRIDPGRIREFSRAMQEIGRMRRRGGAFYWGMFTDAADPGRVVECFMDESWLEHLRHHQRVTMADRAIESRIREFHLGEQPPVVSHLLASPPPRPERVGG
ncbi:MAG: MFS transporter [Pseudomonadota bacterium]|nr:MFS transporter [Pseudomonadota bacterium]